MAVLLLSSVEYGNYISPIKFAIFPILFFSWLLLVKWVYQDAKSVGTKESLWTLVVFCAGALAAIIWLVMPLFIVGMLLYLIVVGTAGISYVMHRNTKVPGFEKVLTTEHFKGLFVNENKNLDKLKNLTFITANNNEVPIPQSKTPDFFGYKAAYDIINDAIWRRASHVVCSPTQQNYDVAYQIDGTVVPQTPVAREQMEYFIHFIKHLADLDIEEKRKPQKGKFRTLRNKESSDWEVASSGSNAGEQLIVKQITRHNLTKLTDIGLSSDQYEQLKKISSLKQGLVLITGPRKSGVTTTFYSLLRNHDAFINSISTLERLPSADLLNITQNVFALSDSGTTTYAKKLQSVVRMGSDIIGVAECQDPETARIASEAANDGKILYVTLEADNVLKAIGKWIQLVGDKNLVADTLTTIICQRLFRKLCNECRQAYEPNKDILKKFNIPAEKAKVLYRAGKVQYNKHGKPITCENCQGTGFYGRMCVFEIITLNDELRKVIKQSASLTEIGTQFRRAKMIYLQEQALKEVVSGVTAINEIVRIFSTSKDQKSQKQE